MDFLTRPPSTTNQGNLINIGNNFPSNKILHADFEHASKTNV